MDGWAVANKEISNAHSMDTKSDTRKWSMTMNELSGAIIIIMNGINALGD
jgi:hypothetical protein